MSEPEITRVDYNAVQLHQTVKADPQPFKMCCPACGRDNDMVSAVAQSGAPPPEKNDAAICFGCASILIFDGDPLTLRFPTVAEQDIYDNPEVALARMAVIQLRVEHAKAEP